MKKYKHLTLQQRQEIYSMRERGYSLREIAENIGCHKSTVSRELKRNGLSPRVKASPMERAKHAHDLYKERKSNSRRGLSKWNNEELVFLTLKYFREDKWSPEQISNYINSNHSSLRISTPSIYSYIKKELPHLIKELPCKGKPYRSNISGKRSCYREGAKIKRNISERPSEAQSREEFGHWEFDTIHGKKNGSKEAILTLVERKTRLTKYFKLEDLSAEQTRKVLVRFLHNDGKGSVLSITGDNGSENALWNLVEKVCEAIKFYFCNPYASWQKGSVERFNRELRRFYPKGTDWSEVSEEELKKCEDIINSKPRKCLNWKTPAEYYSEAILKIA